MTYRVRISSLAEADTQASFESIRELSPDRARAWYEGILAAFRSLETMPERCPVIPEADEIGVRIRHLLYGKRSAKYRIIFHVEGDDVFILRVRHGSRDKLTIDDLDME
jgi:plasmid stabilization system protein ParE